MSKWIETTLGDEFHVIMGQSPPSKHYNKRGEGLPFFQGKKEFGQLYPKIKNWSIKVTKEADKDDVLLSIRAPIGPVNLSPEKCGIGRGLAAIKSNSKTPTKFIFYLLKSKENELKKTGTGTTFNAITKPNLISLSIKIPESREERELIVQEIEKQLTRLDAAVESLKATKKKLDVYQKSVLKAAFEGNFVDNFQSKEIKLGKFERKGGGTPSTKKPEYWNGDINWITSANIDEGGAIHYNKKITGEGVKNSSTNIIPKNSVVMATRVGLGKVAVNEVDTAINQDCQGIICKDDIDPHYLMWQLKSKANEIIFNGQGTTIDGITVNKLENMDIKSVDRDIQERIVQEIESRFSVIDKLEETIDNALKKSEQLRKSILKSAFEGNL